MPLRGNRVLIGFSLPGKRIGTQSRVAVRTDTFLGRKNMQIQPRGSEPLQPNGILPSGQTTTPYQAPPALGGTPDHPGSAVGPGSPCSYAPPADALPRPWNPLPCMVSDQDPLGTDAGGFPTPPDIQASPPHPGGTPPTPGIPSAARPGDTPPDVPGSGVPLAAHAPPGARRDPLTGGDNP